MAPQYSIDKYSIDKDSIDIPAEAEGHTDNLSNKQIYTEIIDYLNEKAGTKYRASTKKTQSCIHARIQEGFTVDDFKAVIDKKCADWIGTEYEQYLRPETLFGTKFESYLNAKSIRKKPEQQEYERRNSEDIDLTGIYC